MSIHVIPCPACGANCLVDPAVLEGHVPCCPYCHQPLVAVRPPRPPVFLGANEDHAPLYIAGGIAGLFVIFLIVLVLQPRGPVVAPKTDRATETAVRTMVPRPRSIELPEAVSSSSPPVEEQRTAADTPTDHPMAVAADPPAVATSPPTEDAAPAPAAPLPGDGAVANDAETAGVDAAAGLRYGWKQGDKHAYEFTVTVEANDRVLEVRGIDLLAVESTDAVAAQQQDEVKGSGTGFVVRSDGFLVTCAHVVEDATSIEAHLGGKTYPVTVLGLDRQHDLAVLRIDAAGLPVLPLADSDKVRLAENVRAVGFPLSTMLGGSVKVAAGTVAGVLEGEKGNLIQVDASINPGNSGGPVVNELGEVIGVVSAKMTGEDVSNVGFAVPANDLKSMLLSHGVAFSPGAGGPKLDGPDLAGRVTPSVAMLTVVVDQGVGHGRKVALELRAASSTASRARDRAAPPASGLGTLASQGACKLVVDEYGRILDVMGEAKAASLLCPLGQSLLLELPFGGDKQWKTEETTFVAGMGGSAADGSLGYGRSPRASFPRPDSPSSSGAPRNYYPALERSSYEVQEGSGDSATIKIQYELKTLQRRGEPPVMEVVIRGQMAFDKKNGVPTRMELDGVLSRSGGGESVRAPVKIVFTKGDYETLAKLPQSKPGVGALSAAITEAEIDQVLEVLRSPTTNPSERTRLAEALAVTPPIESKRREVCEALEIMLQDIFSRNAAVRALCEWGNAENVLVLARNARDLDPFLRAKLIKKLGAAKDSSAAEALVQIAISAYDRSAVAALKGMGSVAEDAVIPMLDHYDAPVRFEACGILATIGGGKSVAALTRLLRTERDYPTLEAAKAAIRQLRSAVKPAVK